MPGVEKASLDSPGETRTFARGKVELVTVAGSTVGRFTFEPGWRWSEADRVWSGPGLRSTAPGGDRWMIDLTARTSDRWGQGRRRASPAVGLLLVVLAMATAACGTDAGRTPRSIAPTNLPSLFPTAAEVGEALGLEVEAMGVQADMSQAWEHIDVAPGTLVAKHVQGYRWPPGGTGGTSDDAMAGVLIDIVMFRNSVDGAAYGGKVAATVSGTAFSTGLSADLVTTGSWTSDQGFGGSTLAVQAGSIVVLVTAFKTGAAELAAAVEEIAALILARIDGQP